MSPEAKLLKDIGNAASRLYGSESKIHLVGCFPNLKNDVSAEMFIRIERIDLSFEPCNHKVAVMKGIIEHNPYQLFWETELKSLLRKAFDFSVSDQEHLILAQLAKE